MSKKELNLPIKIEVLQYRDCHGKAVLIDEDNDEAQYINNAVNTYHERDELIKSLFFVVKTFKLVEPFLKDSGVEIEVSDELIQKTKNILGE